jgi:hypothetical protein
MALAQTSLNIDILTVATLYNRGSPLSSSVSYVPTLSNIGAFSQWSNTRVESLFVSNFYTYSNGEFFLNSISSIETVNSQMSTTAYMSVDVLSSFLSTNTSQVIFINSISISTVSSYSNLLELNSTSISTIYSSINDYFSSITPGVSTTAATFFDTLFSPQASTLIEQGIYYYINRDRIGEFTASIENPNPLFGGVFGSNDPLPWYWSNEAPRYIGPGISSLVDTFTTPGTEENPLPFYDDITINFPNTLNNISTGVYNSNVFLDEYRADLVTAVDSAVNYIDGGSSISTLYTDFNSTFISTLDYASTLGPALSTFSTFICEDLSTNSVIPTFRGFTIGSYISSANIAINRNQNFLNSTLYSTIVQPPVFIAPFTVFSTIVYSSISAGLAQLASNDSAPGFYKISSLFKSTLVPFYSSINVSTNYDGYLTISTNQNEIFSTFSTNLPYIIGRDFTSSLNTLNRGISSLSTAITVDTSTIYGLVPPYITGPGVSSIQRDFSTNISISYIDYSHTISTIITPFNAAFINVNPVLGLSTLNSTVSFYNSTILGNRSTIIRYISSGFQFEYLAIQSTNASIIDQINTNVSNFISAGISSYNASYSTFGYVSSMNLNQITYINSQTNPTTGAIYTNLSKLSSLESKYLQKLNPYAGSTVYYNMLPIISDYSTSRYAKGDIVPRFISRSTTFLNISTLSSLNVRYSSATLQVLGINTSLSNEFNLNIQGSASIIPQSNVEVANVVLPNIQIYANDIYTPNYSLPIIQNLVVNTSTIAFNNTNLVLKRFYERKNFGFVGINTATPAYSLDIATGDARKPTGTAWVTASDSRVKQNISTVDFTIVRQQISSLRLVSYMWDEPYRSQRSLSEKKYMGFLSQEVEKIFPDSVSEMPENGFPDFKSLDTDQLYKAKFGLTQNLLSRLENLKTRLNALKES